MMLSYRYRLYPSKEQEQKLLEALKLGRHAHNFFLEKVRFVQGGRAITNIMNLTTEDEYPLLHNPESPWRIYTFGLCPGTCFNWLDARAPARYGPPPKGHLKILVDSN